MQRFLSSWFFATTMWMVLLLGGTPIASGQSITAEHSTGDPSQIQHVVIIVKQNKSFDHFFGAFPGADGATTATLSTGQVVNMPEANDQQADYCQAPACNVSAIDGGKMDRYDTIPLGNQNGNLGAFSQELQPDIPNYWSYAQNFVLADHMFSSNQSAGFPNQLDFIAANTGGAFDNPTNPTNQAPVRWGCDSIPGQTVHVFDAIGNVSTQFPCFDFPTLMDSLTNAGLTWKFYAPTSSQLGYEWNAPDAISHIRNSPQWSTNVVDETQFAKDAKAGNLPTVSWVVPIGSVSEHPGPLPTGASTCNGENWTVQQINAVMQGPLWNSTAIFVTWDDSGGFYDHEPPPVTGAYTLGLRVPLLIVSPFSQTTGGVPGYITHTQYSDYSFLKFVETVFGLPPLTNLDQNSADMLDAFDFTQTARAPLILNPRSDCPLLGMKNLSLGSQLVNTTSAPSPFQIFNNRSKALKFTSITTSANFGYTTTCGAGIGSGGRCTVNVTFTPTAVGPVTGQLTVTDNDPSSPQVTNLTGIGSNVTLSPTALKFAAGVNRPSSPQSLTLTNHGSGSLGISLIQMVGDFAESDNCGSSLDPGASCLIHVTFSPGYPGQLFGSLFVHTDDPGSPNQILLSGNAIQAAYSTTNMNFGTQQVGGTSKPKNSTLTNLGSTNLTIASMVVSGDYAQTNNCGSVVGPGNSCVISVTFSPTQQGTRPGTVTVTDSDMRNPQVITLTGIGQDR